MALDFTKGRQAFGGRMFDLPRVKEKLATVKMKVEVARAFVDRCLVAARDGKLSPERSSMAKLWATELQGRVLDACVQLHGGYGYMAEYPVARAFVDSRISRIYGGTSEIMKEIIGRSLELA